MRLATTSTAAAGGRAKTTEVGLLSRGGGGSSREGEKPLELVSGATGANHPPIAPHELLEPIVAVVTAIVVDRHVRSFAEDCPTVKRIDR
jgi:hypothetical protein